jgi:hypothetical protein
MEWMSRHDGARQTRLGWQRTVDSGSEWRGSAAKFWRGAHWLGQSLLGQVRLDKARRIRPPNSETVKSDLITVVLIFLLNLCSFLLGYFVRAMGVR